MAGGSRQGTEDEPPANCQLPTADRQLIDGLSIGHANHSFARTGATVVLCPRGAVGGVAVRGGAPGTRETDLLRSANLVDRVHAVLLTGGSAFGLSAADGVVRWLRERGFGWPTSAGPVPIVPAAVLFDLHTPDEGPTAWPDAPLGYAACEAATPAWPTEGSIGAGRGATVGKLLGIDWSSPGGIGAASLTLPDGATVGAIVAVNALGHIIDPHTGHIVAGPRLPNGEFGDTVELMLRGSASEMAPAAPSNTTIGVVWTDARLDKTGCNWVAGVAHDGLAHAIRPAHTQYDGDTLFTLSLPPEAGKPADRTLIGVAATEVVAQAILRAVTPSGEF